MAADPSRLVDVRATLPPDERGDVYEEHGSGLLVTDDLVLTAAHVVFDGDRKLPVRMELPDSRTRVEGRVVWPERRGDTDAALVRITGETRPPSAGRAPRWGRFTGREARQLVDATGFPRVMVDGGLRIPYQLSGHINPQGAGGRSYLLSVEDAPADPGSGRPSPWAGLSGAAAMSGGTVVGVVVIDTEGWNRKLLTVVPAHQIAADPAARKLLGMTGHPISVELAPLLTLPTPSRRRLSPAQLLRADEEVIPFHGRDAELRDLTEWCTSGEPFAAMLIGGPGGRGKTRLAQALIERVESMPGDWVAGLLSPSPNVRDFSAVMSTSQRHPVLLVVDYAESRRNQLDPLLWAYQNSAAPPGLRLLLLARAAGSWWTDLCSDFALLLDEDAFLSLTPLHPLWDRQAAHRNSLEVFASRLAEIQPNVDWPAKARALAVPDLNNERFGDPLALQLEALLGLLGSAAGDGGMPAAPELRLIAHERQYWRRTLDALGLRLSDTVRDQAVAAATLIAVRDWHAALELLERVPALTEHPRVAEWLHSLYPTDTTSRYWGPLQPDRLGEHHIGAVTRADPTLLYHLLGGNDDAELQEALVIIGRAMTHQPHLRDQLAEVLREASPVLSQAASRAAERIANPLLLQRILPPGAAGSPTFDPDDYGTVSSWGHDTSVPERLSEIGRDIGENPFTSSHPLQTPPPVPPPRPRSVDDLDDPVVQGREHERRATEAYEQGNLGMAAHEFEAAVAVFHKPPVSPEHLTRTLLAYAAVLSDQRRFPDASAAVDEAVSILSSEVDRGAIPAAVLGRARDLQAGILAEMGNLEVALSFGYDAVRILRKDDTGPSASPESHRDYGKAVSNLAGLMHRTGRPGEAGKLSHEALEIFEDLRRARHLGPNDATYGRVILGNARIVATERGSAEALQEVDRAIAEFDRISRISDDNVRAMAPELASAYSLRSVLCADLGDHGMAVESAARAVGAYEELARMRRGFLPDLATSLVNLANLRLEAGDARRAVEHSQRAVNLLADIVKVAEDAATTPSASLTRFLANAKDTLARAREAAWRHDPKTPGAPAR